MDVLVIISIAFVICGFIAFLFLLRGAAKAKAITHYETIRDKLTVREQEEFTSQIEEDYSGVRGFSIANLIGGFVTILVGVSLLGPISEQVNQASNTALMNATNTAEYQAAQILSSIGQIAPAFFALAILGIAVGIVYVGLHRSGTV